MAGSTASLSHSFERNALSKRETANLEKFYVHALLDRLDTIRKEIEGVRFAEDIEYVHRMRVATRRVRTTLDTFLPFLPGKKVKAWEREIGRVTRQLGRARDLDIQIDYQKKFFAGRTRKREIPGVERLMVRFGQQRESQQKRVVKAMDRLEAGGLLEAIEEELKKQGENLRPVKKSETTMSVSELARETIHQRLEELLGFEYCVGWPEMVEELHQMRIAAKGLRYATEIFAPLYGHRADRFLKVLRKAQNYLGEIHDCDVWLTTLPKWMAREKQKTLKFFGHLDVFPQLQPGVDALAVDRRKERERLYEEFVAFWEKTKEEKVWDALGKMTLADVGSRHPEPVNMPEPEKVLRPAESRGSAKVAKSMGSAKSAEERKPARASKTVEPAKPTETAGPAEEAIPFQSLNAAEASDLKGTEASE